jgi:hypothetical protein
MFFKNKNNKLFFDNNKIVKNFFFTFKTNCLKNKNNLFFIFYKFFNNKLILFKNHVNINFLNYVNFNASNLIILDYIFFKFFKFFNYFILNFFNNYQNILILDSCYKNNFFLYTNMYSTKDLINYKSFFFPKSDYFSKKN